MKEAISNNKAVKQKFQHSPNKEKAEQVAEEVIRVQDEIKIKEDCNSTKGMKNQFRQMNLLINSESVNTLKILKKSGSISPVKVNKITNQTPKSRNSSVNTMSSLGIFKNSVLVKKNSITIKTRNKSCNIRLILVKLSQNNHAGEFDNFLFSKTNFNTKKSIKNLSTEEGKSNHFPSFKPYETSCNLWKKTLKSNNCEYSTGQFVLPLFSQQKQV